MKQLKFNYYKVKNLNNSYFCTTVDTTAYYSINYITVEQWFFGLLALYFIW